MGVLHFGKTSRPGRGEFRKTQCNKMPGCLPAGRQGLMTNGQNAEECNATGDAQRTGSRAKNLYFSP